MKRIFLPLMLILLSFSVPAKEMTAKELSRIIDNLFRSKTSRGVFSMTINNPDYTRTLKMKFWTKGLDYTLIRILSPKKERGISTLKRENNMWNYLPRIKKTIRIPPSMMMNSWMGSDFTNDDLVKETSWEDDYHMKLARDGKNNYLITSTPKEGAPVTWSKVLTYVNPKDHLPIKQDFYDEKKRLVRTMKFLDKKKMGGRIIPARLELIPLLKEKQSTTIIYEEMEYDPELGANIFTLGNLKKGN